MEVNGDFENEGWKWKLQGSVGRGRCGRGGIFSSFPPNVKTLKKYPKNPKKEKNAYVSSNLVLKFSFFQGREKMVEKCWETAVTKRLAKVNYRGVGYGFDSSNCTKTLVSYPSPPPPNPPLNSLRFSIESPYHSPPYTHHPHNSHLNPSHLPHLPQTKFTKN